MRKYVRSIRSKLLIAFLAVAALTAAIGLYAVNSIEQTGELVKETYDKPLMAINFSRSAQFAFSAMERAALKLRSAPDAAAREAQRKKIDHWHKILNEDLEIARSRSLSARARGSVDEIIAMVAAWRDLQQRTASETGPRDTTSQDVLGEKIIKEFDLLVDYTAGDGFRFRQAGRKEVQRLGTANTVAMIAALLASLVIAYTFSRRILRPLRFAVDVAQRVAGGELDVEIRNVRNDETGNLLRAMDRMQNSLRLMMEREVRSRQTAEAHLIAIERSNEGLILVDPDDRIILVNRRVARLVPHAAEMFHAGLGFSDAIRAAGLIDPQSAPMWKNGLHDLISLAGRGEDGFVCEAAMPTGRWVRLSMSRRWSGEMVAILSDITELMEREEKLREAKEIAEQANKAKSSFLANMSHELRTPLNAVIGFAQIISQEAFGPLGSPQYNEYIDDILKSGEHLLDLINDVLDMSKIEAGEMKPTMASFAFPPLAHSCLRLIETRADKTGILMEMDVPKDLPPIYADKRMIKQILLNLLSNAVKFTSAGGSVTLLAGIRDRGGLEFTIRDTGCGIPPDQMEVVMQPFGQADSSLERKYEGTGLGLPLVKALTELHGGTFHIESILDEGTAVTIVLPETCFFRKDAAA